VPAGDSAGPAERSTGSVDRVFGAGRTWPRLVVGALLRLYQRVISPLYPPSCRFYPSCSQYALIAVERHGVLRGAALAGWRLLRCNPWNPGGVDDVPPARVKDARGPGAPAHQH
jgi:putative membrane protein insertion efficiency factor